MNTTVSTSLKSVAIMLSIKTAINRFPRLLRLKRDILGFNPHEQSNPSRCSISPALPILEPSELEYNAELLFSRSGLQHNVLRKLRRGQYNITAELDLHGLRVEEARQALSQFLYHCHLQKKQCVHIIHGKGYGSHRNKPVLKSKVNHWLRQRDEVLAFCSARPVDGGTGAIYLLLKRK